MDRPYRVGVVGFGVAGATAAALLARAGHAVDLFERAPVVGPVGAGILLMPSGQMVLDRLGLLERVAACGEVIEALDVRFPDGRSLIRLPFGEIEPGCHACGLHRGDLFAALHDLVRNEKVGVRLGHEVCSCRTTPDGVFLGAGGGEHGPFDFVVAADGARSALRGLCRLPRRVHEYDYGAAWIIGRSEAVRGRLHQVVRGSQRLLGLLPMGGGRCSLFWGLRRDRQEAIWHGDFGAWRREVLALCPLARELLDGAGGFRGVAFTTYRHVWLRRWHTDRVVFLGDAAHAMSPHLGQGINLALLDAWHLAAAVAATPTPAAAFAAYTQARRVHLRFYAVVTFLLSPFFQSGGVVKGWGRDWALPLMTRIPWLRRQMALTMGGLKGGFFSGRIRL
jgi:2-polyprenyl-6-methoxyphenol hydroxylase-like FAD-dependent oxidoreductase